MSSWDIIALDNSASMIGNKKALVDGFNELVSQQQNEKSGNLFTVITFNDKVELFKEDKFENFELMKFSDIITGGTTALYDAIGNAYDMILKNTKYKNITITIITDGLENDSKNYTIDDLDNKKKIIEKDYTIKMIFIGTQANVVDQNIGSHATYIVDCKGDLNNALNIASRTISGHRDSIDYIPTGSVTSAVAPLVIKRSGSCSIGPPNITKCKSFCHF